MHSTGWSVVVPLKRASQAKSRLRGVTGPHHPTHEQLVLALARDTVRAALRAASVGEVIVVTGDEAGCAPLAALGARLLPDLPDAGLNTALTYAADQLPAGTPVAALTADLPALRPAELAAALAAVAGQGGRGFVVDAVGTGTTLLAAWPPAALAPAYGADSAARHAASGAYRLAGTWPGLRRDVDTPADLAQAAQLGLGPDTATVLAVQATVAEFDEETKTGAVLLDNGQRLTFSAAAFAASGLQRLRLGQRVQVETAPDEGAGAGPTVQRVTIPTMPRPGYPA